MKRKPDAELIDSENPEWAKEDFEQARPASVVLPELFGQEAARQMLSSENRRTGMTQEHVNIRLDVDVVEAFKSMGRGWQTRLNSALRDWLKENTTERSRHA